MQAQLGRMKQDQHRTAPRETKTKDREIENGIDRIERKLTGARNNEQGKPRSGATKSTRDQQEHKR
jgi:hypothetical protein